MKLPWHQTYASRGVPAYPLPTSHRIPDEAIPPAPQQLLQKTHSFVGAQMANDSLEWPPEFLLYARVAGLPAVGGPLTHWNTPSLPDSPRMPITTALRRSSTMVTTEVTDSDRVQPFCPAQVLELNALPSVQACLEDQLGGGGQGALQPVIVQRTGLPHCHTLCKSTS
ncbi:MAG: hypothetical protein FRX49_04979 [Trebouxia sp. A1-2]|nr:MAG: hypothetical protein FRX49_04979 [Trebouxia sp. A1-2]